MGNNRVGDGPRPAAPQQVKSEKAAQPSTPAEPAKAKGWSSKADPVPASNKGWAAKAPAPAPASPRGWAAKSPAAEKSRAPAPAPAPPPAAAPAAAPKSAFARLSALVTSAENDAAAMVAGAEKRAAASVANAEQDAAKLVATATADANRLVAGAGQDVAKLLQGTEAAVSGTVAAMQDKATLLSRTAGMVSNGVLGATGSGLVRMFDFKADQQAFQKISAATPQQLAAMGDKELATTAEELLNPSLPGRMFGASAQQRSEQALRLITARGTDAGSMDAVLARMPYGRDPVKEMSGPAQAKLQSLLDAGRAKPGDWSGLKSWFDKATGTVDRKGTSVTPLVNGQTAFPKMYEAIDKAKSSVNLTVFAFESDKTGWEMAKHLSDAAKRGVDVKVIYDPMGSAHTDGHATDQKLYQSMRDAGVQVIAQTPGPLSDHLNHRKITVVDGKTGFIGGMNVGENYSTRWHDCHSQVEGQGVADLQQLFVQQWKGDGGKLSAAEEQKLFPKLTDVGTSSARMVGHVGQDDQLMKASYLRAIDTAQKQINIASPYFSDPDVVAHLKQAVARGVDVTVVLPQTNNQKLEQSAERAMYQDMLAGGIHVHEYYGRPMAHDKVATFDGRLATIGSSNLDARSLDNNDEANVWADDPKVAQALDQQLFAVDLGQSKTITKEDAASFHTLYNRAAEAASDHL